MSASNMAGNYLAEEAARLLERSRMHYIAHLFTSDIGTVQEAVGCAQEVFDRMLPDAPHDQKPIIEYNLARPLVRRFLQTRQTEDISRAIDLFRSASQSQQLTDPNPVRQMCLKYLSFCCLVQDAKLEGSIEQNDLRVCMSGGDKIDIEALAHKLLTEDDEIYQYYEGKVPGAPLTFEASLESLDLLIQLHRQALKLLHIPPFDHMNISYILLRLGDFLHRRSSRQGRNADLDEQINCFCTALKLPMTNRLLVYHLSYASRAFLERYWALRRREDLDDAVNYAKRAAENVDSRDIVFSFCMSILGIVMQTQFIATGNRSDLDASIYGSLCAVNNPDLSTSTEDLPLWLYVLSQSLSLRHQITGQFEDLRHAIQITQRAADLWPPEDPERVRCLMELSGRELWLGRKEQGFMELSEWELWLGRKEQVREYTKRGLRHFEEAWSIGSQDPRLNSQLQFKLFNNMGRYLFQGRRWDEATHVMRSLGSHPGFDSDAGRYLFYFSDGLYEKFRVTGRKEDIDEAITTGRRLMEYVDNQGERRDFSIIARLVLANCLGCRYELSKANEDREEALAISLEGFQMPATFPYHRIDVGQVAIAALVELDEWDRAHNLSKEIVHLFVILNSRSLTWIDKQYWLQLYSNRTPIYASIALQTRSDLFEVIDMLETCRGSVLGHVIDNRADLDGLMKVAPNEAKCFANLRDVINAEINPVGNSYARVEDITGRENAEAGIRACLEKIRKLDGFHRFLLGPTESEVKAAAAQGPILIVNVTSIRSDVIIITKDTVVLLPLPELKHEQVLKYREAGPIDFSNLVVLGKKNKEYLRLLKWLWDSCVKLIFQKLDELLPATTKPHVWWIAIGTASSLPFHAAGIYAGKKQETALSRAISSYTPTLKLLIDGRQKLKNRSPKPDLDLQRLQIKPKLLIVTMRSTPGMSNLPGVQDEADKVREIVQGAYSPLLSHHPSAKDTMEQLEKCEVVHFACHGQSMLADPSASHLLLQRATNGGNSSTATTIDELRVRDVAALNLSNAKLAFLSACSTAENKQTGLANEGLHLASAFYVAGYLHSVGNLWPADDDVSAQVVEDFYRHLVEAGELGDGQNVAKALNEALLDVSKEEWRQPLNWAQFVHFGI